MQKTTMTKKEAAHQARVWYEIDAQGIVLGKLAVCAADLLRGKSKPTFNVNVDCGDYVIIRNANKVVLTGNKLEDKAWYSHSGYIGGLRKRTGREMMEKYSDEMVYLAVKGMLPKNRLAREILKKLTVYQDAGKDHSAQKPTVIKVK